MTITILLQNLRVGGIQRVAVSEANELHHRGHTVYVITLESEREGDSMKSLLTIPAANVTYVRYPRLRSIAGLSALVRELTQQKPGLLITHHWFANTVGRIATFFVRIPVTLSFEHSTEDARRPLLQFRIDRFLQNRNRFVIAVSASVRDSLLRHGIRAQKIRVVPNGTELGTPHEHHGSGNTFLFIGRLVHDKGADLAVSAVAATPGALLTVVGDGPERGTLESLAKQLGAGDRIRFTGYSLHPESMFAGVDCLLMPSRREGFGLVALEALAAGVPVIASDVVGANGVVRDGVNGLIIPNDSGALSHALGRFMGDAPLRERLTAAAPKGLERYSGTAHVDALLSLL